MQRTLRFVIAMTALAAIADAAPSRSARSASRAGLCIDVVRLKTGETLRGVAVRQDANGLLQMAAQRDWLHKTHPRLLEKVTRDEKLLDRKVLQQLSERIKQELNSADAESRLAAFLRIEQNRVETLLADPAAAPTRQFVCFEWPKTKIARIVLTSPERRRIAAWAWSERLPNVETQTADSLTRELKQKGIDLRQSPPDLSDQLPLRPQDDREWAARMAIVAYALGDPLDFQGMGDVLIPTDSGTQNKDKNSLVAKLAARQIGSLLLDVLGPGRPANGAPPAPDAWLKPAEQEADRRKARAFRATRVESNVDARQATVVSVFRARLETGAWETIWSDRETEDIGKQRAGTATIIANDPQVKSALAAIKSLGLTSDADVQKAIGFGAATMAAQQSLDSHFCTFRDAYVKQLNGPPLAVSTMGQPQHSP